MQYVLNKFNCKYPSIISLVRYSISYQSRLLSDCNNRWCLIWASCVCWKFWSGSAVFFKSQNPSDLYVRLTVPGFLIYSVFCVNMFWLYVINLFIANGGCSQHCKQFFPRSTTGSHWQCLIRDFALCHSFQLCVHVFIYTIRSGSPVFATFDSGLLCLHRV